MRIHLFICLTLFVVGVEASACSVCFGDPESLEASAMNWAIATLLGVTLAVLGGVSSFAFMVHRRASALEAGGFGPDGVREVKEERRDG